MRLALGARAVLVLAGFAAGAQAQRNQERAHAQSSAGLRARNIGFSQASGTTFGLRAT